GQREDYEQTLAYLHEVIPTAREEKRWRLLANALHVLADISLVRGESDAAREAAQENLAIAERIGDDGNLGVAYVSLGTVALDQGDLEAAANTLRQAWDLLVSSGDRRSA